MSNIPSLSTAVLNAVVHLENELDHRKITNGKFLDLGTGPATQAIWLAKKRFQDDGL